MKTRNTSADHMQQGQGGMLHGAPHEFTPVQGMQTNYDSDSCSNDDSPRFNANRLLKQTANQSDSPHPTPDGMMQQSVDLSTQQRDSRPVKRSFKPQNDEPLAGSMAGTNSVSMGTINRSLVMGNPVGNKFGIPSNNASPQSPPRPVLPQRFSLNNNLNDGGSGFGGTFNPANPSGANIDIGAPDCSVGVSKFGTLSGALPGSPPGKRNVSTIKANAERMIYSDNQNFGPQAVPIQANTNTGLNSNGSTVGMNDGSMGVQQGAMALPRAPDGFTDFTTDYSSNLGQNNMNQPNIMNPMMNQQRSNPFQQQQMGNNNFQQQGNQMGNNDFQQRGSMGSGSMSLPAPPPPPAPTSKPTDLPTGLPTSLPGTKSLMKMMGRKNSAGQQQGEMPGMVQDFSSQQNKAYPPNYNEDNAVYSFNDPSPDNSPNRPPPIQNPMMNTIVEADMKVVSDSDDEESVELNQEQTMIAAHNRMREQTGERQCDEVRVGASDDMNDPNAMNSQSMNRMQNNMGMSMNSMNQNMQQNPMNCQAMNPEVQPMQSMNSMGSTAEGGETSEQLDGGGSSKKKRNLPQLHAATPIHVPFDRFGQSLHGRKDFVTQPLTYADRSHSLQARVVRVKEGMTGKMFPTYHLCLRNGPGNDETILLAAQKQTAKKSMSSYYLITLDPRCFQKGASTYVGKLRSNWSGTEYILYSDGDNPKKLKSLRGSESSLFDPNTQIREEMLAIKFSKPGNAPRRMVCVIPAPKPNNVYERQVFKSKPYTSLIHHATGKEALAMQDGIQFLRFANKIPAWDARRQTFTINFHGRVRQPSSKNFQLVENEAAEDAPPIVQFGRWTDDVFHLDGMWPFSALQIFALALSTFDTRVQEALKMTY